MDTLDANRLLHALRYSLRRAAEIDRAEKERLRYRVLFENVPAPVWLYERESLRIIDVNDAATELYGYSKREFLAMTIDSLWRNKKSTAAPQRKAWRPDPSIPVVLARHHRRDGSALYVELKTYPQDTFNDGYALTVANDITARVDEEQRILTLNLELEKKFAERTTQLSKTLTLYQALVDQAPLIICYSDPEQRHTQFNRAWFRLMGGTAADWMSPMSWLDAIHHDDAPRVREQWSQCRAENLILSANFKLQPLDGRELRHVRCVSAPVRAEDGSVLQWMTLIEDVTERTQIERNLKLSNESLRAFSYSVSHDLRAPLHVIDGFGEELEVSNASRLDEHGCKCLDRIRSATQRMLLMIEGLLVLSQISYSPLSNLTINFSELCHEIIEELSNFRPDVCVDACIEPKILMSGDPGLIRILAENLIGNALKFSAGRKVSQIKIGHVGHPDRGHYYIEDNGVGFDMRYVDRLFTPFERLHSTDDFPGTGIGLATVRRIIDRYGGQITLCSKPGLGTRVEFSLYDLKYNVACSTVDALPIQTSSRQAKPFLIAKRMRPAAS